MASAATGGRSNKVCALGATHYRWRSDVSRNVQEALARVPEASANTYTDHPWPGWDHVSVDFWDRKGRGYPLSWQACNEIRAFLFNLARGPRIRHTILGHTLWTSFGGFSYWAANDHSGKERHLHVTYWK